MVFAEFLDESSKETIGNKTSTKDVEEISKRSKTKSSSLNIGVPKDEPMLLLTPKISVIGVGGAGGNAVNNMIASGLKGTRFLVANTDAQALSLSDADCRIQLGLETTKGLGAGMRPEVGKAAAEEAIEKVIEEIKDSNMLFIAVGMGGGTGTGAAPVIAKAAKELGILTVAVATKPFDFEGKRRAEIAANGIEELLKYVDTMIIIPNQNLFRVSTEKTTFLDAFKMADTVLCSGVKNITDLIMVPGLISLDFADVSTIMKEMGRAMMGSGEAEGENRAILAAEAAITNQLLDDNSMKGAKGVLINITGGVDLTLVEVDAAAERIKAEVDPNANIIFGECVDPTLEGKIRVSVIASGITPAKKTSDVLSDTSSDIFGTKLSGFSNSIKTSSFSSSLFAKDEQSDADAGNDFATNSFKSARASLSDLFTSEPGKTSSSMHIANEGKSEKEPMLSKLGINSDETAETDDESELTTEGDTDIKDAKADDEMPVVVTSDDFSAGTEPIMTIYADEHDTVGTTLPDHLIEDAKNTEEPKRHYSNLFTKVTKFTLGRKSKNAETDTLPDASHKLGDLGTAVSDAAGEYNVKLGSAYEGSGEDSESLEIPEFLRRR